METKLALHFVDITASKTKRLQLTHLEQYALIVYWLRIRVFCPIRSFLVTPMVKLRLKRFGKKREVSYRIVAAQSTSRRDGRPLEELGFYNPRTDETRLNVPAIVKRLQDGAQPTETVRSILNKAKVFDQVNA